LAELLMVETVDPALAVDRPRLPRGGAYGSARAVHLDLFPVLFIPRLIGGMIAYP
jgi:hypothetical protein